MISMASDESIRNSVSDGIYELRELAIGKMQVPVMIIPVAVQYYSASISSCDKPRLLAMTSKGISGACLYKQVPDLVDQG